MASIQATVVQRADNFIQRIKCFCWSIFYLLDRVISSLNNRGQDVRSEDRLFVLFHLAKNFAPLLPGYR